MITARRWIRSPRWPPSGTIASFASSFSSSAAPHAEHAIPLVSRSGRICHRHRLRQLLRPRRAIHSLIEHHHDVAGKLFPGERLDLSDPPVLLWEREVDALLSILISKGFLTVDELRRSIEGLPASHQRDLSYYEKWAVAISLLLLESGAVDYDDLAPEARATEPLRFEVGDFVKVLSETDRLPWPKPHLRTPGYVHGATGEIVSYVGEFSNPELLAYRRQGQKQDLYRVKFRQKDLWEHYDGHNEDHAIVEIYSCWLARSDSPPEGTPLSLSHYNKSGAPQPHHPHHHHQNCPDHHEHGTREQTEQDAVDLEGDETPARVLARMMKHALHQKGVVSSAELKIGVEKLEQLGRNFEGPRMVAKAWTDPEYKRLLLHDASAAAAELGIVATNSTASTVLTAMENTPDTHNLVVCTLCSCYPRSILGLSPAWYRSRSYRSRAIREPRAVLKEFGTVLPESTKIQVHDSTADLRYMILPLRPAGTESWSETELAKLVTRDSMIGVSLPLTKAQR